MTFDNAAMFISADAAGNYVVAPAIVRWRAAQGFRIADHSVPSSSDPGQPAGQPFNVANVRKDTNPNYRIADLTFVGAINVWHSCFDNCDSFSQAMIVDGNSKLQTLTINVSCLVHPQNVLARVSRKVLEIVAETATAIATVFLLVARRIFSRASRI